MELKRAAQETTSDADKRLKKYQESNAISQSTAICCSFHLSTS
jgi:hypothetical protein